MICARGARHQVDSGEEGGGRMEGLAGCVGGEKEGARIDRSYEAYRVGLPPFAVIQQHPVVDSIFHFSRAFQSLGEQISHEVVVGSFLETELPDVVQVDGKFLCRSKEFSIVPTLN